MIIVNNLQGFAPWIVAREVDGELWYWGNFYTREKAQEIAYEIGGIVVQRSLTK